MRHLKKIRETDAGQIKEQDVPLTSIGFTNVFRSLILDLFFYINADFVTRHLKKICESDEGQIKEQDVPLTEDSSQVWD